MCVCVCVCVCVEAVRLCVEGLQTLMDISDKDVPERILQKTGELEDFRSLSTWDT